MSRNSSTYDLLILGSSQFSVEDTMTRYEERGLDVIGITIDGINRVDGLRFRKLILADGTYIDADIIDALAFLESISAKFV